MNRCRLCVSYIISSLLIGSFIFVLIRHNLKNDILLKELQAKFEEITGSMVRNSQLGQGENGENHSIDELIDLIVRKRIAFIMDDLYSIKKQLEAQKCSAKIQDAAKMGIQSLQSGKDGKCVNLAALELGARIMTVEADPLCPSNLIKNILGMRFASNPPVKMLQNNVEPGNCFAFKSREAKVLLKLPYPVLVKKIGIEHISKNQSPTEDVRSAPREFKVYGFKNNVNTDLGAFQYENKPTELFQQFDVKETQEEFEYLRFHFLSNHGHENYTCIYRVTVHGK